MGRRRLFQAISLILLSQERPGAVKAKKVAKAEKVVIDAIGDMIWRELRPGRRRNALGAGGRPPGDLRRLLYELGYSDHKINATLFADGKPKKGEKNYFVQKLSILIFGHMVQGCCDCWESESDRRPDFVEKARVRCREQHDLKMIVGYAEKTILHWRKKLRKLRETLEALETEKPIDLAAQRAKIEVRRAKIKKRIVVLKARSEEDWYTIFLWRAVLGSQHPLREIRGFTGSILFKIFTTPDEFHLGWKWESGKVIVFERDKFLALKEGHHEVAAFFCR